MPLLPPGHLRGVVLDAGCGRGLDAVYLASMATRVIALDLSMKGTERTYSRTRRLKNVDVVRGDLQHIPLVDGTVDFIYSFGVLMYLDHPEQGFGELVRVLRPGGLLGVYVYEDFSTRPWIDRVGLRVVNAFRAITSRLPHRVLMKMCILASPMVFLLCTIPYRLLSRFAPTRELSERFPYRHGTGPGSLTGDLYDRFAPPLEHRYSASEIRGLFQTFGLEQIEVHPFRGWVGLGYKSRLPVPGVSVDVQESLSD